MNPSDWISAYRLDSETVVELTNGLTDEQFNWKPSEKKWSIGECLEHLNITNGKMYVHINKGIQKAQKNGLKGEPPFKTGFIGRWFLKGSGPKGRPIPAPGIYRPASSDLSKKATVLAFRDIQSDYIELVELSDGLDLGKIMVRSAVTPLLRFNAATWFEAMKGHQERHFDQIRRLLSHDKFPKDNVDG